MKFWKGTLRAQQLFSFFLEYIIHLFICSSIQQIFFEYLRGVKSFSGALLMLVSKTYKDCCLCGAASLLEEFGSLNIMKINCVS